jgi:hypothetical protein
LSSAEQHAKRLVELASSRRNRPCRARSPAAQLGFARDRQRQVKRKVVPLPIVDSTPISPPIWSMMRLQIASPRPVPPKRRLIEESAWAEIAEQLAELLGRDADAGIG